VVNLIKTSIFLLAITLLSCNTAFALSGAAPSETALDPSIMVIDEQSYLGSNIGKDFQFLDEFGKEFKMEDMLDKPLILLLSYYNCDGYCPTVNNNLIDTLEKVKYQIGDEYRALTVSFDKNDDLNALRKFSKKIGMNDEMRKGWKLAILKNKDDIKAFTSKIGYKFFWSYRDGVFLHPSVYIVVSPEGKVVRYLYGSTVDEGDVELSIVDALGEKITPAKTIDFLVSVCYSYNFEEGKYTVNYPLFIGLGALFFGVSLVVLSLFIYKKKRCV
jgi:protein SCO1/2